MLTPNEARRQKITSRTYCLFPVVFVLITKVEAHSPGHTCLLCGLSV